MTYGVRVIRTEVDGKIVSFLCDTEHEAKVVVGLIDSAGFRFQLEEFRVRHRTGKVKGIAGVVVRIMIIGDDTEIDRLASVLKELAA